MQVPKTWGFSHVGWLQRGFFQVFCRYGCYKMSVGGTSKIFRSTEWPALGPWEVEEVGDSCQKLW